MVTLILLLLNSSNQGLSLQISKSIKEQCPGADFCRLLSLLNMEIHSQDIAIKVVSTTVNSSDRPTWLTSQKKKFSTKKFLILFLISYTGDIVMKFCINIPQPVYFLGISNILV